MHRSPEPPRRPWRATLKPVLAASVAALPLAEVAAKYFPLESVPVAAAVVAAAASAARFLTEPSVDRYLRTHIPWLTTPPEQKADDDAR